MEVELAYVKAPLKSVQLESQSVLLTVAHLEDLTELELVYLKAVQLDV